MKITTIKTGTIQTWLHLLSLTATAEKRVRIEVPVCCYYIEHNEHKVLFDAGQIPLTYFQDPLADFLVKVTDEETLLSQLAAMGIDQTMLTLAVLSHAHSDHCNGLKLMPQVPILLQRAELPRLPELKNPLKTVVGEYDIFGDGRLTVLPTPGHTAGHQSLLVELDDQKKVLLTGDCLYFPEDIKHEPTEAELLQKKTYFDSLQKLRNLRESGTEIIFGHYPYKVMTI